VSTIRSHLLFESNTGEETVKRLRIGLILVLAAFCVPRLEKEAKAQSEPQFNYSHFSLTFYAETRLGYQSLPVLLVGVGAGKLGANEPFKIIASALRNTTAKKVTAVKFGWFIFSCREVEEVLEQGTSDFITVDLDALQTRQVQIPVVNVDEIPFFRNQRKEQYRMEVAVTEVRYDDGSIWQGAELPQKIDPAMVP
jgi:hypothetical protein